MKLLKFTHHQLVELHDIPVDIQSPSEADLAQAYSPPRENTVKETQLGDFVPPIHRLPAELVADIFLHSVKASRADILDRHSGVWVLNKACSRWRSIVHSSPLLWSTIIISDRTSFACNTHPQARRVLEVYLKRSRACPLSVEYSSQSSSYNPLLQILVMHSHRWKKVSLCMPASLYPSLNEAIEDLPLLEEVQLEVGHVFVDLPPKIFQLRIFQNAPRLHVLKLPNWHFSPVKSLLLPWHQLTAYSSRSAQGLADVLPRIPNVVKLEVEGFSTHFSKDITALPHLRQLNVCADTTPVFLKVVMPQLERLNLLQTRYTFGCQFLRSLCDTPTKLQALTIDYLGEGLTDTLLSFLRNCSTIRCFTVSSWSQEQMSRLLIALTVIPSEKRPCLAPRLEEITFCSCLFPLLHHFVDMVESRCRYTSPLFSHLLKVNVRVSAQLIDSPLFSRLEALKYQGLEILV